MVSLVLDHLAVSGATRDVARAYVEEALGLPMQDGGQHRHFATHNHLMGLDGGLYLEAISIDPGAEAPPVPRWFDLDNFEGAPRLTNWICGCSSLEKVIADWPDCGEVVALQRGDLRWSMAVPTSGRLPWDNLHPALIEWHGGLHPTQMLSSSGARLKRLTVCHPEADRLASRIGAGLDLVRFEVSATPKLHADFDTPHGARELA